MNDSLSLFKLIDDLGTDKMVLASMNTEESSIFEEFARLDFLLIDILEICPSMLVLLICLKQSETDELETVVSYKNCFWLLVGVSIELLLANRIFAYELNFEKYYFDI